MKDYDFDDFTEQHYAQLLDFSVIRYKFINYDEILSFNENKEFMLWRHDVDVSPHRAYALAKIENRYNVKATYFIMLSSDHYNTFESEIKTLFTEILSLGHTIGLHFDPTLYPITCQQELEHYLTFEKEILEKLLNTKITTFSFHNPTEEMFKYDNFAYAGLINTYAKDLKEKIYYCSDSNGYWRHKRLYDFLVENTVSNRQVLTHPEWWQEHTLSPRNRISRSIDGRAQKRHGHYDESLKRLGRENVR